MKFEIDIDLPEDVLREWEPVAFRVLRDDDAFVSSEGNVLTKYQSALGTTEPRLILRRRFQWPAWLKCRYLTWMSNGVGVAWMARPFFDGSDWKSSTGGGCFTYGIALHRGYFDIECPGGDWRTRIETNPNWKE